MIKQSLMIISFSISLLLLQGCNDSAEEVKSEDKQEVSQLESTKPKEKVEPSETKNLKNSLTIDEFNAMFKQDPEETQYPHGKFELKDGTIVNADYLMYGESSVFDYAMVTFYEDKLAKIQVDTESNIEDIEKGLGVSFKNAIVEPYKFGEGYEIIFNEIFTDENITRLPNEWD
ncbi:hypothetical protein BAOM_3034 [Peribacillus asahii]|uniref:Lipoprotein n=1 Tax=Peribacillus asahii TaxID=228899 RepID=A0A3Q9RNC8_9BACI|nr:hypothetical protein [Peribacillus asahii]AZV43643.1 hypothetical protein BAOM_3034 [Peribacillus asahii]